LEGGRENFFCGWEISSRKRIASRAAAVVYYSGKRGFAEKKPVIKKFWGLHETEKKDKLSTEWGRKKKRCFK